MLTILSNQIHITALPSETICLPTALETKTALIRNYDEVDLLP
jgi:hypothetical protein